MTHFDDDETDNAPVPPLPLELRPVPPGAWAEIVRRARRRRDRAAIATAAVAVVAVAAPSVALIDRGDAVAIPAHRPASSYSDVCDTAYDQQAPVTDTFDHPIRLDGLLISPAGANRPAVSGAEIRRRTAKRGTPLSPGTQIRYGLVRYVAGGSRVYKTTLRWVITTCGRPRPRIVAGPGGRLKAAGTALGDDVLLVSDSGAATDGIATRLIYAGACDQRLTSNAPESSAIPGEFHVGEVRVTPPTAHDRLGGRDRVRAALQNRFPGTQIRLGRVQPLHSPGKPRLRWVVTTCGLDGGSVRPELPGVVNEVLVYDARGRLLQQHRSGPWSEAEALIPTLPPVPFPAPTYQAASPNMCSTWSHAYPDFRQRATAAGYVDMQGCYLQADSVVIFVSKPGGRAAAAVYHAASGQEYDATYKAKFPFARFTFVDAPVGETIRLVKLLNAHVAEVELSGAGATPVRWKFDAPTSRFLPCSDTTATRAACGG